MSPGRPVLPTVGPLVVLAASAALSACSPIGGLEVTASGLPAATARAPAPLPGAASDHEVLHGNEADVEQLLEEHEVEGFEALGPARRAAGPAPPRAARHR